MRALIRPGRVAGAAMAPPSKSMAHRLMICAGLSRGASQISNMIPSEDLLATSDCLSALGAKVVWQGDAVQITGCGPMEAPSARLNCRESGSTLRFMIPLCLTTGREMHLCGSEKLLSRPLEVYEVLCRERGLQMVRGETELLLKGRLAPGLYKVPGGISSQFISGLLFALPLLDGPSKIVLTTPPESRPYIDMTLQALHVFGARADWEDGRTLRVPGRSVLRAQDLAVEGDWSNAAYIEAFNGVGGDVQIHGLREDSLQGDRCYREYFSRLVHGPAVLDVSDCPDLAPVLLSLAAANHGCTLTGTRRLRFKESDRGAAMAEELSKFGAELKVRENSIILQAFRLTAPKEALSSHNDHRIAMALALLLSVTGGAIEGAEAVRKSLPDYWSRVQRLGLDVELAE